MKSSITNQPSLPVWKRRTAWLALIPALVILCLAVMPQAQSSQANINNTPLWPVWARLEGSWEVTATQEGAPPFEVLASYTAGGVALSGDPTWFPLCMNTVYCGAWARKGPREFVSTWRGFAYDPAIAGLWKILIKETLRIEPDGDTYNGVGTVELYAPDGTVLGPFPDTTHAVRIKAE